jgi:hypothetical protein
VSDGLCWKLDMGGDESSFRVFLYNSHIACIHMSKITSFSSRAELATFSVFVGVDLLSTGRT